MSTHTALHLVARPEGLPKDSDFELRESTPAELADGQIRIAVRFLSIDPAMRVWMTEQKSYWPPVALGEVMRSAGIGEVVESRNEKYPVGCWITGMTGAQNELVSDGKGMQRFDASKLPHPGWALSVFGATGLTAYFGLVDIGKPKSGEVLVVRPRAGGVPGVLLRLAAAHRARPRRLARGARRAGVGVDLAGRAVHVPAGRALDRRHARGGAARGVRAAPAATRPSRRWSR